MAGMSITSRLCGGGIVSRLILADVAGHGLAVAEVAIALRSFDEEEHQRQEPGDGWSAT